MQVQGLAGPDMSAVVIERRLGRNECRGATECFHFSFKIRPRSADLERRLH